MITFWYKTPADNYLELISFETMANLPRIGETVVIRSMCMSVELPYTWWKVKEVLFSLRILPDQTATQNVEVWMMPISK